MSSRRAFPKTGNENMERSSRQSPPERGSLSVSRKRPRTAETPSYDSNSVNDDQSREHSVTSEGYGVNKDIPEGDHVSRMGRHLVTRSSIRGMSTTPTETGFDALFGTARERISHELDSLDPYFFYGCKDGAELHIDQIRVQLDIMQDLHRRLYSDFCNHRDENEDLQDQLSRLRDQIKSEAYDMELRQERFDELESSLTAAEKERSALAREVENLKMEMAHFKKSTGGQIQKLRSEKFALADERDQAKFEIDVLKKDMATLELSHEQSRTKLQTLIKDHKNERTMLDTYNKDLEGRNASLKSEKEKLDAAVEARYAEIEALKASLAETALESNGMEFDGLPPAVSPYSSRPRGLVKDEAWDSLPRGLSLSLAPAYTMPLESPAVAYAGDYHTYGNYNQLGFGISSFLSNHLQIELAHDQPLDLRHLGSVVTEFMFHLGAFADIADVAISPVGGFWHLCQPWTSKSIIGMAPRPNIEEQFVQLCFLIPYLKSRSQGRIWWATVQLINSLMNANHASLPRAGMAFLATMVSINLAVDTQNIDVHNAATATALCELCRFLQETFTELSKPTWNIGAILGPEAQDALATTPIGRLSACLANPDRSNASALRERLATAYGDKLCFVTLDEPTGNKRELGFLSCDDDENFLILNLVERSVRFVDRKFAYYRDDEDRKKHLLIKRPSGEVLLDMTGVAPDVRVFWVRYVEY